MVSGEVPGWICFSAQDWWYHNRAHSDFQLLRRVAEQRPVLFVNSIGMRLPTPGKSPQFARRILRKARSVARFLSKPVPELPNFHVLTPLILPFYGSSTMRALNARLVRQQVRAVAKHIGIDPDDAVLFVTIPTAVDVIEGWPRRALVTNRSDLHSAFEETDQSLIRDFEHKLVSSSDVALYSSHSLLGSEGKLAGERAVFLDHGVDYDRFASATGKPHPELADVPRPIIGFFGGIDDYVVDLDLLKRVAEGLSDCSLVLIGDATLPIDDLVSLPNVHWFGFKPYEEIPSYGAAFDVALMPWLKNTWIEQCNPIKLKEYLAIGLPVVSTDFPEVHFYAEQIAIAPDHDAFIRRVREAVDGQPVGTLESRKARVEGVTWDRQAEELVRLGEQGVV